MFSIFIVAVSFIISDYQQFEPKEIIKKAEDKLKISIAEVTIKIIRPNWKREMSVKSWSKVNEYALILVTAPAKEKGLASLKRKKEVWSWIPSNERTFKLPPSMIIQFWMGTDFTNDDFKSRKISSARPIQ